MFLSVKEIPICNSPRPALVDDEDYDMCASFRWQAMYKKSGNIYAGNSLLEPGQTIRMHRLIMGAEPGQQVDHRDNDGLNNQKSNFRFATNAQNMMNRKKFANKTSKYKGVHWDKASGKWRTALRKDNKLRSVGRWDDERLAAAMYNVLAKEHFGEFALLNPGITEQEEATALELHSKMRKIVAPTKYKGVMKCFSNQNKPWKAQFVHQGKAYTKSAFATPEEAALAYNELALQVFGEKAVLNHV